VNGREREALWWDHPEGTEVAHGLAPYIGPDTSSQLMSLRELEHLSAGQGQAYLSPHPAPRSQPHSDTGSPAPVPRKPSGIGDRVAGRHHASPAKGDDILRQHGGKFASFSAIGGGIFVAGLLIQAALTTGLHVNSLLSYVAQAVISVEASYFLNRWLTWKGVRTPFWGSFLRYNLQKVVTVTANLILYGILLKLGIEYLLDNILLTIVFTFVNYIGADRLVFLRGSKQMVAAVTGPLPILTGPMPMLRLDKQPAARSYPSRRELPSVSVVIPVRSNEKTILAAVESVLSQDYPLLRELILVGSPNESTWSALSGLQDPRLVAIEVETPPGIRDANFKRDLGVRETSGDLVSLIDSDMVIPPDWMSNAVRLLIENEVDCVAGVMRSIRDDFWGRFVDGNRLGAKTPRAKSAYLVTAEGFGAAGFKPPITADILFTRKMYEDCPIDSTWSHGSLEDYEWFWRVVERSHQVLVSNELFGWHHHRSGLKNLTAEYRRSARGCAFFIRAHRESPFAQKRVTQATILPMTAFGLTLVISAAAYMHHGKLALASLMALALTGVALLSAREFARTRTIESLIYPLPALALGLSYTTSLTTHLIRNTPMRAAPTAYDLPVLNEKARSGRIGISRLLHPLTFILAVQAALSLTLIWSNTAFSDEADYLWVGGALIGHVLHGTAWPTQYAHSTLSGSPFIYPPLGALANMIGGLAGARILSLLFMLYATCLVFSMGASLYGRTSAICAAALWSVFSPGLQLGAFATYDALSVTLTACAAWVVVRINYSHRRGELIAASAVILAIAEATAYSGIIMIPVVVMFAILVWSSSMGAKKAISCAAWFAGVCVIVFVGIMTASKTWPGIMATVLSRQITTAGYASVAHVFDDSWTYSGVVALLALLGALFSISGASRTRIEAVRTAYLTMIAFVIPLAQAHETTAVSLKKHLAYGAIFACLSAGYGLARLTQALPAKRWAVLTCSATAFAFPAVNGFQQSQSWYQSWPDQASLMSKLSPLLSSTPDVTVAMGGTAYLCDYYYADSGNAWEDCDTNLTISSAEAASTKYIVLGYPASIAPPGSLPANFLLSSSANQKQFLTYLSASSSGSKIQNSGELAQITAILEHEQRYRLIATGPYDSNQSTGIYTIWERNREAPAKVQKVAMLKKAANR
jgi:putative flippase GtrA/glycosyltransferase involved in cell wall biosynthesis